MLLRPLPDSEVIRLSQTNCLDVRRTRKQISKELHAVKREIQEKAE